VLRLLATANFSRSLIFVTLMMESISFPKRRLLQEPHGVTSQKKAFFFSLSWQISSLNKLGNWKILFSRLYLCVVCWKSTYISEEHVDSIFRVQKSMKPVTRCEAVFFSICSFNAVLVRIIVIPWKRRRRFSPKQPLTYNEFYSIMSEETEIFKSSAVRSFTPTTRKLI
jgi:hypothetical protein